jgi:hypothetical protein
MWHHGYISWFFTASGIRLTKREVNALIEIGFIKTEYDLNDKTKESIQCSLEFVGY